MNKVYCRPGLVFGVTYTYDSTVGANVGHYFVVSDPSGVGDSTYCASNGFQQGWNYE